MRAKGERVTVSWECPTFTTSGRLIPEKAMKQILLNLPRLIRENDGSGLSVRQIVQRVSGFKKATLLAGTKALIARGQLVEKGTVRGGHPAWVPRKP
jgi:hypothetical protein